MTTRGLKSSSDILKHFLSPTLSISPLSDSQLGDGVNGKWPITPEPRV